MNLTCLVASAMLMIGGALAHAQTAGMVRSNDPSGLPFQLHDWSPIPVFPTNRLARAKPVLMTNTNAPLALQPSATARSTSNPPKHKPPIWGKPLQPGLYTTAPYSGLVLVPGPHPDDRAVVGADADLRMPIIKPHLEFIPRSPATK